MKTCLCNHLESAHRPEEGCNQCPCTLFEWDPIGLPELPHSQHTAYEPDCLSCQNLLDEAREIAAERPWEDA